jgi:hypothetical protein
MSETRCVGTKWKRWPILFAVVATRTCSVGIPLRVHWSNMASKFTLLEGEEILAECPSVFKKQKGSLLLTSKRLAWNPVADGVKFIGLPLSYITSTFGLFAECDHSFLPLAEHSRSPFSHERM